ncbi:DotU family type IV/VI secretion system protein [Nautilia lithotrophica]
MKQIVPIIAYVMKITENGDGLEFEKVYNDILYLLKPLKKDDELFPVVCWIDEKILSSEVSFKNEWLANLLQKKFFHTNKGGELFYEKMKSAENKEVYYFMLKLGFKGMYFENKEMIDKLLKKHYKNDKPDILFPFGYLKKPSKNRKFIKYIYNYKTIIFLILITIVVFSLFYFNLELLIKSKGLV